MRVAALEPESCVSILDTDMEAEVAASMENEAEVAAAEEEARRRLDAAAQVALQRVAEEEAEAQRARAAQEELERVSARRNTRGHFETEPLIDSFVPFSSRRRLF